MTLPDESRDQIGKRQEIWKRQETWKRQEIWNWLAHSPQNGG